MNDDRKASMRADDVLAESARTYVRKKLLVDATCESAFLDVGGGTVVYGGRASGPNVSRGWGLGVSAPLTAAILDEVTSFLGARNWPARLTLSSVVDESGLRAVESAGFSFDAFESVHVRALDGDIGTHNVDGVAIERILDVDDERLATVYESGAQLVPTPPALHRLRYAPFFGDDSATFLATVNGRAIGAAAVTVVDGGAHMLAGVVAPEARGRGIQRALLGARLSFAKDQGAEVAVATCAPHGASSINLQRAGMPLVSMSGRFERRTSTTIT